MNWFNLLIAIVAIALQGRNLDKQVMIDRWRLIVPANAVVRSKGLAASIHLMGKDERLSVHELPYSGPPQPDKGAALILKSYQAADLGQDQLVVESTQPATGLTHARFRIRAKGKYLTTDVFARGKKMLEVISYNAGAIHPTKAQEAVIRSVKFVR